MLMGGYCELGSIPKFMDVLGTSNSHGIQIASCAVGSVSAGGGSGDGVDR